MSDIIYFDVFFELNLLLLQGFVISNMLCGWIGDQNQSPMIIIVVSYPGWVQSKSLPLQIPCQSVGSLETLGGNRCISLLAHQQKKPWSVVDVKETHLKLMLCNIFLNKSRSSNET